VVSNITASVGSDQFYTVRFKEFGAYEHIASAGVFDSHGNYRIMLKKNKHAGYIARNALIMHVILHCESIVVRNTIDIAKKAVRRTGAGVIINCGYVLHFVIPSCFWFLAA
jgi:hypothetical protein